MLGTWGAIVWVAATAALAGGAGWRLARLARRFSQSRLAALAAFFLFFALMQLFLLVETVLLVTGPAVRVRGDLGAPEVLFWARHAAFFVALTAAVVALGVPGGRKGKGKGKGKGNGKGAGAHAPLGAAWVPFFLLAHPVLLILEGMVLFYLVLRAAWNHVQQSDPGSLRVATGFSLLLLGHLMPFLLEPEGPPPLGIANEWAAALVLLGTGVLFWATFGGRKRAGGEAGG